MPNLKDILATGDSQPIERRTVDSVESILPSAQQAPITWGPREGGEPGVWPFMRSPEGAVKSSPFRVEHATPAEVEDILAFTN